MLRRRALQHLLRLQQQQHQHQQLPAFSASPSRFHHNDSFKASLAFPKQTFKKDATRHLSTVTPPSASSSSSSSVAVALDPHRRQGMLSVKLDGGGGEGDWLDFPFVWLRDNCQCPLCFHPVSFGRTVLLRTIDMDIRPASAWLEKDGTEVHLEWSDGHLSPFSVPWLVDRAFTQENVRRRREEYEIEPRLWGKGERIRRHQYEGIMGSEEKLLAFLTDLDEYGVTLIQGMREEEAWLELSARLGFAKPTHYGKNFVVEDKPDPNNAAYTSATLGLHLDLPFYEYVPGVQFLHCIRQHSGADGGGENEFSDAFNAAEMLREESPEDFKVLVETPVTFWDVGAEEEHGDFHKVRTVPTIKLGRTGKVEQIHYNNQVRDSRLSLPDPALALRLYSALSAFDRVLYRECVRHKLEAAECVAFDNRRVLHGRQGFTSNSSAVGGKGRKLVGWYVDWDELVCRRNVLRHRVGKTNGAPF